MHTLEVYGVWEGKSICQEKGNTVSNVSNKVYGVHSRVAGVLAELGGLSPQQPQNPENFVGVQNSRNFEFPIAEYTNSEISSICG